MTTTFDIVVVGDLNADLILQGDVTPVFGQVEKLVDEATLTIGGSSAIFACGAARLGLRVALIAKVGNDQLGRLLQAELAARGIDLRGLVVDPTLKTGLTVILARAQDRALLTYSGTIGALRSDEVDMAVVRQAQHLHMGCFYLLDQLRPAAPALLAAARDAGLTVSLDTNYDPTEQWAGGIEAALEHVDLFLPNATELCAIARTSEWERGLTALAARVPVVAVKLGQAGAAVRRGASHWVAPVPAIHAVDSTGAGDSFDAGAVYGFLAGWEPARWLRLANACGALSTRATGGTSAQPTYAEAETWLLAQGEW